MVQEVCLRVSSEWCLQEKRESLGTHEQWGAHLPSIRSCSPCPTFASSAALMLQLLLRFPGDRSALCAPQHCGLSFGIKQSCGFIFICESWWLCASYTPSCQSLPLFSVAASSLATGFCHQRLSKSSLCREILDLIRDTGSVWSGCRPQ